MDWGSKMDYDNIKQTAKDKGISIKDLCALAPNNDPFYTGRDAEIKAAKWFAGLWQQFGYNTGIHLRRVHYQIVSQDPPVLRPNGKAYGNTQNDWSYLCSAGKYARYLNLVDPDAFEDRRNPKAIVNAKWKNEDDWGYEDPTPGYEVSNVDDASHYDLPDLPELETLPDELPELPNLAVKGYMDSWGGSLVQQMHHIEIWVEKTTMNDVLKPLCTRYNVNLVTGAGEMSITSAVDFMERVRKAKRAARILYISDYDPAGLGMPISVARKIEFFQSQNGDDLDIRLQPVMLTADQVREYKLPRTPVKDSDLRKAGWEASHGEGQVELDALEALYPGKLATIVEKAILNYYDPALGGRAEREKKQLTARVEDECEGILSKYTLNTEEITDKYDSLVEQMADLQERFTVLVEPFQPEIDAYRQHLSDIKESWQELVGDVTEDLEAVEVDLDNYPLPEPDLPEESNDLLYDSTRGYLTQLDYYKQYRSGGN